MYTKTVTITKSDRNGRILERTTTTKYYDDEPKFRVLVNGRKSTILECLFTEWTIRWMHTRSISVM